MIAIAKNGEISRKHGNTLVSTLRKIYGETFAAGKSKSAKFSDVLDKLHEASVPQLVHDHGSGKLDDKVKRPPLPKRAPSTVRPEAWTRRWNRHFRGRPIKWFAVTMVFLLAACSGDENVTGSTDKCAKGLYPAYHSKNLEQCVAVCMKCVNRTPTTCHPSCNLKGAR